MRSGRVGETGQTTIKQMASGKDVCVPERGAFIGVCGYNGGEGGIT